MFTSICPICPKRRRPFSKCLDFIRSNRNHLMGAGLDRFRKSQGREQHFWTRDQTVPNELQISQNPSSLTKACKAYAGCITPSGLRPHAPYSLLSSPSGSTSL